MINSLVLKMDLCLAYICTWMIKTLFTRGLIRIFLIFLVLLVEHLVC